MCQHREVAAKARSRSHRVRYCQAAIGEERAPQRQHQQAEQPRREVVRHPPRCPQVEEEEEEQRQRGSSKTRPGDHRLLGCLDAAQRRDLEPQPDRRRSEVGGAGRLAREEQVALLRLVVHIAPACRHAVDGKGLRLGQRQRHVDPHVLVRVVELLEVGRQDQIGRSNRRHRHRHEQPPHRWSSRCTTAASDQQKWRAPVSEERILSCNGPGVVPLSGWLISCRPLVRWLTKRR